EDASPSTLQRTLHLLTSGIELTLHALDALRVPFGGHLVGVANPTLRLRHLPHHLGHRLDLLDGEVCLITAHAAETLEGKHRPVIHVVRVMPTALEPLLVDHRLRKTAELLQSGTA